MANFVIRPSSYGQFYDQNGNALVDTRLLNVLQSAAAQAPSSISQVEAFSGRAGRSTGTFNHPSGWAVDVQLYDANGNALANYAGNPFGVKSAAAQASYPVYEQFAQVARQVQQSQYPDLSNQFRWGGYFTGGVNPGDLMHFDISGGMSPGTPPISSAVWQSGLGNGLTQGVASLQNVQLAQPMGLQATPQQLDQMTRTVLAEARGEGPQGMAGVAAVMANRAAQNGGDLSSVISTFGQQFAPPMTGGYTAAQYQQAQQIVQGVLNGSIPDPTNGATYFANPKTADPAALQQITASAQPLAQIGNHTFYGTPSAAPAPMQTAMTPIAPGYLVPSATAAALQAPPAATPPLAFSGTGAAGISPPALAAVTGMATGNIPAAPPGGQPLPSALTDLLGTGGTSAMSFGGQPPTSAQIQATINPNPYTTALPPPTSVSLPPAQPQYPMTAFSPSQIGGAPQYSAAQPTDTGAMGPASPLYSGAPAAGIGPPTTSTNLFTGGDYSGVYLSPNQLPLTATPTQVATADPMATQVPGAAPAPAQQGGGVISNIIQGVKQFAQAAAPVIQHVAQQAMGGGITGFGGGPLPGSVSNAATFGSWLGGQQWHQPSFNPISGGSQYQYFTGPPGGIGGYNAGGQVFTYPMGQGLYSGANPGQSDAWSGWGHT